MITLERLTQELRIENLELLVGGGKKVKSIKSASGSSSASSHSSSSHSNSSTVVVDIRVYN